MTAHDFYCLSAGWRIEAEANISDLFLRKLMTQV